MKITGATYPNNISPHLRHSEGVGRFGIEDIGRQLYDYGQQGLKLGSSIGLTFVGFLALLAGSIGKTLAPDKSSFDLLSLFGIIAGGIMSAIGLFKITKIGSQANSNTNVGSNYTSDGAKEALNSLIEFDSKYHGDPVDIRNSKLYMNNVGAIDDATKDNLSKNMLSYYDECLSQIQKRYTNLQPKTPLPKVTIGNKEFSLDELQDETIGLIGNLIFLRGNSDFNTAQVNGVSLKSKLDPVIGDDGVNQNYLDLLPTNYLLVYNAARGYVDGHMGKNDSVKGIFEGRLTSLLGSTGCGINSLDKLKTVLAEGNHTNKKSAWEYLNEVETNNNTLRILDQAIKYVMEHSNSEDQLKARQAFRLRQALIAGFRLEGKTFNDFIESIRIIKDGDGTSKGLAKKIEELSEYQRKIREEVISKPGVGIKEEAYNVNDVFPRRLGLIEFVEVVSAT